MAGSGVICSGHGNSSEGGVMVRLSVVALLSIAVLVVSCGMPLTKRDLLWTGVRDTALDKMLLALEELGYTIRNVNKADGVILAKKVPGSEAFAAAMEEREAHPFEVSITVREQEDRCLIKLTVSQPGEWVKGGTDKFANEIIEKFKQYAGEVDIIEAE